MNQVIEEGRHAVQGLRAGPAGRIELEHVFSHIPEEFPERMTGTKRPNFRVVVNGKTRSLHPILRDEVYRIGREAVVNAFRHSHAGSIEVDLCYSARELTLIVRDDGRGIGPEMLESGRDRHFGLSGMRERAERIGAKLQVYSNAAGTEVSLKIPGKIAYRENGGNMNGKGEPCERRKSYTNFER
jgi:signal transduction histidine kinase